MAVDSIRVCPLTRRYIVAQFVLESAILSKGVQRATVPAKFMVQGLAGKFILKSAVEDLLPNDIIYRKKMGFPTPWAYWLAGPQLDQVQQMLLEPRTLERGLFQADGLTRLFQEHRAGVRDHGNRIWRLLNLETWMRVCIDGETARDPDLAAAAPGSARVS